MNTRLVFREGLRYNVGKGVDRMKLYHGSPIGGITRLIPHGAEHGTAVFLTDIPTLAAIYAHENHVWYTYCFDRERHLVYDEVFPDQLRRLYEGRSGYIYTVNTDAFQHEHMPWVYLSGPVDVAECQVIPDLYAHLLNEIDAGRLVLRRHKDMPEYTLSCYRQMTVDGLLKEGYMEHPEREYAQFVQTYMPELWEEARQRAPASSELSAEPRADN